MLRRIYDQNGSEYIGNYQTRDDMATKSQFEQVAYDLGTGCFCRVSILITHNFRRFGEDISTAMLGMGIGLQSAFNRADWGGERSINGAGV